MKVIYAVVGAALCASSLPARAQTAPAATIVSVPAGNVLRAGAAIPVRTSEMLTTKGKKLRIGQRIQMETAEAVSLNGQVVIPAGSPVVGEITDLRNKGMWGKSGYINARVLSVRVNGTSIRMTGQFDDKGVTGTGAVVGALVLVPIAGFFATGTSAVIPLGSPVKAFLDEDITVAFAPTEPVAAAAATPAVQVSAPVTATVASTPATLKPVAATVVSTPATAH